MKNGFLYSTHGNRSSSRLIGFIIIVWALALCTSVIYLGKDEVVNAAVAAGTLFVTIAGPAMAFLFWQKKNEINHQTK